MLQIRLWVCVCFFLESQFTSISLSISVKLLQHLHFLVRIIKFPVYKICLNKALVAKYGGSKVKIVSSIGDLDQLLIHDFHVLMCLFKQAPHEFCFLKLRTTMTGLALVLWKLLSLFNPHVTTFNTTFILIFTPTLFF